MSFTSRSAILFLLQELFSETWIAEIRFDYFGILSDGFRVSLRNLHTIIQNDDPIRDVHYGFHKMFDHDDRNSLLTDLQYGLDHVIDFRWIKTRQHFIQKQEIGMGCQRPGHFQSLLLRDVQAASQLIGSDHQPDEFHNLVCDLCRVSKVLALVSEAR